MMKRLLAALLCAILVMALLPAAALASDGVQTVLDITKGNIEIDQDSVLGMNAKGEQVTATDSDGYKIIGNDTSTTNTIKVMGGTHNITISGVNIKAPAENAAFSISPNSITSHPKVSLTLENTNVLTGGEKQAGLEVRTASTLTINGTGSLTATGGVSGAGIGGGNGDNAGSITILGGTVTAKGGFGAAGIGGGFGAFCGEVTIGEKDASGKLFSGNPFNDITVTAIGGNADLSRDAGAGIGSGGSSSHWNKDYDCRVNIYHGKVIATGGDGSESEDRANCGGGAGIGSGGGGGATSANNNLSRVPTINIEGGTVIAIGGGHNARENDGGAGIGGGCSNPGGDVTINNANVKAVGKNGGKDIGAGSSNSANGTLNKNDVYRTILTVDGATDTTPFKFTYLSVYPYLMIDVKPIDGDKLYLYLPRGKQILGVQTAEKPARLFTNQSDTPIIVKDDHSANGELKPLNAAISPVMVSGVVDSPISSVDTTITLTGDTFKNLATNTNISSWFTNMPGGLTAKISSVAQDAKSATLTFSGTPTTASTDAITMSIPVGKIVEYSEVFVSVNANAKWNIVATAVKTVTVSPAAQSVIKGGTRQFFAKVNEGSDPTQTVTWTVEGGVAGTVIDENGNLTVAANETATELIVKATSTVDATKLGTATVTVTTPPDPAPAPEPEPEPEPAPAPSYIPDYNDDPRPVTVYNDTANHRATVGLSGVGLNSSDQLITESDPEGGIYVELRGVAGRNEVVGTYEISLKSGKKGSGAAMQLSFRLGTVQAGQDFTLVHRKADGTYEYFYTTSDANGNLSFGPLYELSPFLLVKGTLEKAVLPEVPDVTIDEVPKTGDSSQTAALAGVLLIGIAALAGLALRSRRRDQ